MCDTAMVSLRRLKGLVVIGSGQGVEERSDKRRKCG